MREQGEQIVTSIRHPLFSRQIGNLGNLGYRKTPASGSWATIHVYIDDEPAVVRNSRRQGVQIANNQPLQVVQTLQLRLFAESHGAEHHDPITIDSSFPLNLAFGQRAIPLEDDSVRFLVWDEVWFDRQAPGALRIEPRERQAREADSGTRLLVLKAVVERWRTRFVHLGSPRLSMALIAPPAISPGWTGTAPSGMTNAWPALRLPKFQTFGSRSAGCPLHGRVPHE